MTVDWKKIDAKWQEAWEKAKIGLAKPRKNQQKFFCIFAYPGVSGFLHVGHMRGYTYTDIIARYKRAKNFNVLFPVGVHASGNIVYAFALKVQKGDKDWLDYLKRNGATEDDIKHMVEPKEVIDYFTKTYVKHWRALGFICDWNRLICTSWPDYAAFISWQFKKLKQNDLLYQGNYYATFCPVHGPVAIDPSETDISKGGNAEKLEFTLIKFKFGDYYLVAATLRPETIFGLTNIWINPNIDYEKFRVGREIWIASHEFGEKIAHQKEEVAFVGKVKAEELLGKKAFAPSINKEIPILPAEFVKADVGTGIVMSVPSDAPYDYIALKELQEDKNLTKKYNIAELKPIPIISTPGYGELPAKIICEEKNIKTSKDPLLKEATEEVYSAGYHKGLMLGTIKEFAGWPVAKAKEKIKSDLVSKRLADIFYDLSEEVLCRCGARVFIKKIPDQWFIKYSDKKLKDKTKEYVSKMTILPESFQKNLPNIIDWFQDRPCARVGNWIGTKLPFDSNWIIEPISDSTLYPMIYVIAKYTNAKKIKLEDLTEDFFNYVFLGLGEPKNNIWKEIREEFLYWYPLDLNIGGKEHQTVHFPVFIFNHLAILKPEHWPKGIFSYWWTIGKGGTKISKSKGGAQPISNLLEIYGADALRLFYTHSASPFEDVEWDEDAVYKYQKHLEHLFVLFENLTNISNKKSNLDKWLLSSWNKKLDEVNQNFEIYKFREVANILLFEFVKDLQWYLRRGGNNKAIVKKVLKDWLIAISPIVPHVAEELWAKLGNKKLVSTQKWPKVNKKAVSEKLENNEKVISQLITDIEQILKLVNKEVSNLYIYVIPKELKFYKENLAFLEKEFKIKVAVFANNDPSRYDPQNKAQKAKPGKPGLFIE
ncbi:MAG: leucine--tRNA ligase [Candidatus Nanoarchaeia archaeon]